jgi:molybdopterin converting factor small subunit
MNLLDLERVDKHAAVQPLVQQRADLVIRFQGLQSEIDAVGRQQQVLINRRQDYAEHGHALREGDALAVLPGAYNTNVDTLRALEATATQLRDAIAQMDDKLGVVRRQAKAEIRDAMRRESLPALRACLVALESLVAPTETLKRLDSIRKRVLLEAVDDLSREQRLNVRIDTLRRAITRVENELDGAVAD